jgi:peptide/nickel transport system substrate-binding protein
VHYSAARFPIADVYLTQFFHGDSIVGKPTAVTNFSHCDVADAEIEAARVETDPDQQLAYCRGAAQIKDHGLRHPIYENLQLWA